MSILLSSLLTRIEKITAPNKTYIAFEEVADKQIHICSAHFKDNPQEMNIALIAEVFKRAIQVNLPLRATVTWKSELHIFYLQMGMLPCDYPLSYIALNYGQMPYLALQQFKNSGSYRDTEEVLKWILKTEANLSEVCSEDIEKKREFLSNLLTKKSSYLKDRFIPLLLRFLKKKKVSPDPLPNGYFDSVNMELCPKARLRWQHAIEDEVSFTPFHRFEHLLPFMSESQKKELNEILD